ncbi:EF-hand calcium-binding domain-containing protein 6-like [Amphiura filiformis]|uniref:EF-hand calcium-binding domain-containing protein 6-like n=1 Tax=Amphiura filiformis TaxID=82378 RepID=UPI003B226E7F
MSQVALSRPASQMGGAKTPGVPNLPNIQHPLSRLGDPDKMNVRGLSSRQGKRPATSGSLNIAPRAPDQVPFSNLTPRVSRSAAGFGPRDGETPSRRSLPKIPHLYSSIPEGIETFESSDPNKARLPVFGARADIASRAESRINIASRASSRPGTQVRLEVDEIELLLKEKMKKGYYEIRKLFISNDPDGRGTVSRDALARIIINFVGRFVSPKHLNNLLARLGLADKQVIKLEEFYACFREPVGPQEMPGWMDPVNRYSGDKPIMSAAQVHLQLKEKARQRLVDVAEIIPQLNPGGSGRILKPEFRNALQKLLFFMDDDEFEKLWNKYDIDGLGVINGEKLMNKLGISLRSGFTPAPVAEYGRRSVSPPTSPQISPRRSLRRAEVERKKSMDVERWLKDKFREGCTKMRREFEALDKAKKGEIEREEFRQILMKFGLKLDGSQLENFLARCNMTIRRDGRVCYREFLQQFQDRSESGVPHKILCNPTHRFNLEDHRAGSPGAATTITAAEATIMGMFQGDFLALLGTFHKIDKLGLNVISQQEFRAAIESKFNFDLNEAEFEAFMDKVPLDDEGQVKYAQFMLQFDSRGGPAPSLFDAKSVYAQGEAMEVDEDDDAPKPMRFEEFKSQRSITQLSAIVKRLVTERMGEVEAAFRDIDESNSGKMSQEDMYFLFQKLHVRPEISRGEIRRLWDTFIVTYNRFLSFEEFVRHFGYSLKSAAFPNAKHSPPKRGDSDFLIRSRKLNCAADMLEDNLRSKVDYLWNDLRKEFLELDPYGTGYVSAEEFRDVLQELCVNLTNYELQQLCKKFDTRKDGRVSYLEFLKPFAMRKSTHRYGNHMNEVLNHPQSEIPLAPIVDEPTKGLSGISARLRQKLVGDWKNMRRAFQKLDTSRTGYLSVPEFRAVLQLCNIVLDEQEVYHVMSEFDERMDGKINYNKFLSDMSGVTTK